VGTRGTSQAPKSETILGRNPKLVYEIGIHVGFLFQ
jgi:hypothetical protein